MDIQGENDLAFCTIYQVIMSKVILSLGYYLYTPTSYDVVTFICMNYSDPELIYLTDGASKGVMQILQTIIRGPGDGVNISLRVLCRLTFTRNVFLVFQ